MGVHPHTYCLGPCVVQGGDGADSWSSVLALLASIFLHGATVFGFKSIMLGKLGDALLTRLDRATYRHSRAGAAV
jgi:hypothetical protein